MSFENKPDPDDCPTGCGRGVRYGHLMCPACWRRVPSELQRAVMTTWRAHQKLMRGDRTLEQVRESRAKYEAAKNAAIASVA